MNWMRNHKERVVEVLVVIAVLCLLLTYFSPGYLFSKTITTGGDTASHYYTAKYLKEVLLPQGQVVGWMPGNYAGFPVFLFYFPLPFLVTVGLSYAVPLEVAFKLVTILGTVLLPGAAYCSLRLLRYDFPIPVFGAVLTLPFLFMEANSMWGGNIPSTLAGEFAFSLAFALSILFLGSLHAGITSNRRVLSNAVLLAVIGFSHGYALLFAGLASLFFVITTEHIRRKAKYLVQVHGLAFLLMGFWIVPLLLNLPNTTRYNYIWVINSIREVFPVILIPVVLVAIGGALAAIATTVVGAERRLELSTDRLRRAWDGLDTRRLYLWFCVAVSLVFYLIAFKVHVVDIRFLPYLQVALCLIAAVEVGRGAQALQVGWVSPVLLAAVVFLWVGHNEKTISSWIDWNYSGFEAKRLWPAFSAVNRTLAGTWADPRVVYEHSSQHNQAGTTRAFESIPLFSGRATLEGIYMQSSLSSPFVFYLQSEISHEISCPLPDYGCSTLNLQAAIRHLQMFNVRDVIVVSDEVKAEIAKRPEFVLKHRSGPYDVYELLSNENRYVTPLDYEPIAYRSPNWKPVAYRWFKNTEVNDRHLVFVDQNRTEDLKRFKVISDGGDLASLPRIPVEGPCHVEENVRDQQIAIRTDCLGKPVLVKVSYHPNWTVEGAETIYLASPSFMLIYPERREVTLRFAKKGGDYAGAAATMIGLMWVGVALSPVRHRGLRTSLARVPSAIVNAATARFKRRIVVMMEWIDRRRIGVVTAAWVTVFLVGGTVIAASKREDPGILYAKGMSQFGKNDLTGAKESFARIMQQYPDTSAASNANYFYAVIHFKEEDHQRSIEAFRRLVTTYPESHWVPEAYYHIGVSSARLERAHEAREVYQSVIARYGTTRWAGYAKDRLRELSAARGVADSPYHSLYGRAMSHFDAGRYAESRDAFATIRQRFPGTEGAEHAMYFHAVSYFKEHEFRSVIKEFASFIAAYPASAYKPEAYYHIAVSHQRLDEPLEARGVFERVVREFPESRWAGYSREALRESVIAQSDLG